MNDLNEDANNSDHSTTRKLKIIKEISISDLYKIVAGILAGVAATLTFIFTPIAHLPLLWIYGEKVEIELINPTELSVGETATIVFLLTPKTFLGVSNGTATITVDDNLKFSSQNKHIINFSKTKNIIKVSDPSVIIKANQEGSGQIKISIKTIHKPEGHEDNIFSVPIERRRSEVVSPFDLTGTWKISIKGSLGVLKITDSNGTIGGIYEFNQPFMGKSNGTLEGWHDGQSFIINLNFGDRQRIHLDGDKSEYPNFIEVNGDAIMQIQEKNGIISWKNEDKFSFTASANLL